MSAVAANLDMRVEGLAVFSLSANGVGGEGRGEVEFWISRPSLRLSPRSFLAGRERGMGCARAGVDERMHGFEPCYPANQPPGWPEVIDILPRSKTKQAR